MSSTSSTVDAADQAWASTVTADAGRRELFLQIIRHIRAELDFIERSRPRGNTTIKVLHPEGIARKAFLLNDRQL